MPDLTPLPPLGPSPAVVADPARLAAAVRAGHQRRNVRTGVAALTVAAAAVVSSAGLGSDTSRSLVPAAPPSPVASTALAAAPTPGTTVSAGPVRASVGPGPAVAIEAGGGSASPSPGAPSSPSAPPPGGGAPPRASGPNVVTTTSIVDDDGTACRTLSDDAGTRPWCVRSRGARRVGAGDRTVSTFEVCRTGTSPGTLEFGRSESGRSLTVQVLRGDREVWTVETGDALRRVSVPAGQCIRWRVAWNAVDAGGRGLARGTHEVAWWAGAVTDDGEAIGSAAPNPNDGLHIDNGIDDAYAVSVS